MVTGGAHRSHIRMAVVRWRQIVIVHEARTRPQGESPPVSCLETTADLLKPLQSLSTEFCKCISQTNAAPDLDSRDGLILDGAVDLRSLERGLAFEKLARTKFHVFVEDGVVVGVQGKRGKAREKCRPDSAAKNQCTKTE
eukprot:591367-Pyramimonas_sp.AAC.1